LCTIYLTTGEYELIMCELANHDFVNEWKRMTARGEE